MKKMILLILALFSGAAIAQTIDQRLPAGSVTDSMAALSNKPSAFLAAASTVATLSGLPTIDGVTMTRAGVVLLANQCQFTASISGTVMTVTALLGPSGSCAIAAGDSISGAASGQTVSSLGSGTGGTGTYNVSVSQTLSSTTLSDPSSPQNGPWCVPASGAWARCAWYPTGGTTQAFVDEIIHIRAGNTYSAGFFKLATPVTGTIIIDTTPTSWSLSPLALGAIAAQNPGTMLGCYLSLTLNCTPSALSEAAITSFSSNYVGNAINVIYDDDPCSDLGANVNYTVLEHYIDTGQINVLALISDCNNTKAAPVFKVYSNFWGHTSPTIGAYFGSNVTTAANSSTWNTSLVAQFDPGDVSANYTDCGTVYQNALSNAANSSVVVISTGTLACISELMQLSGGPALIKAKVKSLYLMGGDYPTGTEFNMVADPTDANYLFANWTSQNGYPPIYLNGFTQGNSLAVGIPGWWPITNPAYYIMNSQGTYSGAGWDELSMLEAIDGYSNSIFTLSANGTNTVNSSTGANSWSSGTASGHYYLTLTNSATYYDALLDGRYYGGAAWWQPNALPQQLSSSNIQCVSNLSGCQIYDPIITNPTIYQPANITNPSNSVVAALNVTQLYTNTYTPGIILLDPNLTSGQEIEAMIGVAASAKNEGSLNFYYSGAGSNSNYLALGFNGTLEPIKVFPDLHTQFLGVADLSSYTVATLPTCNSTLKGGLAYVTDATTPTYNGTLTGSGAVIVPVFCNGTAWTSH